MKRIDKASLPWLLPPLSIPLAALLVVLYNLATTPSPSPTERQLEIAHTQGMAQGYALCRAAQEGEQ